MITEEVLLANGYYYYPKLRLYSKEPYNEQYDVPYSEDWLKPIRLYKDKVTIKGFGSIRLDSIEELNWILERIN